MLVNAKKNMATATNVPPMPPTSASRADCVSAMPLSPLPNTPLKSMMSAVQVQMRSVSVKTAKVWRSPCFTGWLTEAVAATFGALPSPASLLKRPRFMPIMTALPMPPPSAALPVKASRNIIENTSGIFPAFMAITVIASRM